MLLINLRIASFNSCVSRTKTILDALYFCLTSFLHHPSSFAICIGEFGQDEEVERRRKIDRLMLSCFSKVL